MKQAVCKVFVCGVRKECSGAKLSLNGIQIAMHLNIGAAEIVLGKGGTLALALGAVVVRSKKDEGIGRERNVALVVSLGTKESVKGSLRFRLKIENFFPSSGLPLPQDNLQSSILNLQSQQAPRVLAAGLSP